MNKAKCMVYVLLWKYVDGSGCGVVKTYKTHEAAVEMYEFLQDHGNRTYIIIESEFIYA